MALVSYYHGLCLCLHLAKPYSALAAAYPSLPTEARLTIYPLCLHVRLWSLPHYRSGTFANDMRKNLRNVALPGTGVPLSVLCFHYAIAVAFLWVGVPLAALAAAVAEAKPAQANSAPGRASNPSCDGGEAHARHACVIGSGGSLLSARRSRAM